MLLAPIDIGVDLGTSTTIIFVKGKGVVLNEPSAIAYSRGRPIAIGQEAVRMFGRTPPDMSVNFPLHNGLVADLDGAQRLLDLFLSRIRSNWLMKRRTRLVLSVPLDATQVERRALRTAARHTGWPEVHLVEESLAAAIGAGLPVYEATPTMVIDIGGASAEAAVFTLGSSASYGSVRVAGRAFDAAIIRRIHEQHGLLIGEKMAEDLKVKIGAAHPSALHDMHPVEIIGRGAATGLPARAVIHPEEICEALREPIETVIAMVRGVLDKTPPELVTDLRQRLVHLTGGSALLRGLAPVIGDRLGLTIAVAASPTLCVAAGAAQFLDRQREHAVAERRGRRGAAGRRGE